MVVLGGGTGGLVSARIAAGVGARVALIERDRLGGDCLWTGCVPSKSLIAAANLAQRMRSARSVGLKPHEPEIDFEQVMAHVRAAERQIEPQDSRQSLEAAGVEVIAGDGRFVGAREISVHGRTLRFRTAVIATGSEPIVPALPGLREAEPLTNETVWDLRECPPRLAILGGGPVGCELAQAFARLGSRVTLIEMMPRLLSKEEPHASELIARRLGGDGVDVRVSTRASRVGRADDGWVVETGADDPPRVDRILVAAGRRPHAADLGLETAGVRTDDRGAVAVDRRLRTSAAGIFAVGDVTGALPFTHVAAYHARTATQNALFLTRRAIDYRAVPWVTFTDPEVARVGMSEDQARRRYGDQATSVDFDYGELDRAITAGEAYGFVKLVGGPRGRLVGATVAAPGGGEAIAELAAWVAQGAKIDRVSQTVHAYPTLAEGPARAADEYLRRKYLKPGTRAAARSVLAVLRFARR